MTGDDTELLNLGLFDFLYEELDDNKHPIEIRYYKDLIERILKLLQDDSWH